MIDYVKAVTMTVVSLATFAVNIPVIFVTSRSRRFENDSVAKLIASLAVSDFSNGVIAACCAGVVWSLRPGEQVPAWFSRLINSGMFTFAICSIWHLAAVSVVKCVIIVRPLNYFTIFTDRVLRTLIVSIWTLSMIIGGATNITVVDAHFDWSAMIVLVERQNPHYARLFGAVNAIVVVLVMMIAYMKVFLVVRRHMRCVQPTVHGRFGSTTTIFGSSVRSAKNLFVMCAAY